jgi:hypothetical protein
MKKGNIIILAFSAVLASCSTGNEITSNFFDDGIYFDPTYRIDPYVAEETQEYIDSNILPDYAYSESFDYYDPNMVSATQPSQSYTNYNGGGGSGWGFNPSFYFGVSFGNSFYNPYSNPYYNPYDYGFGGYPGYGYPGYGYPGYGYPGYGYGYPGYGYPGYGYPGYCPSSGGSGNSNPWIGNSITSDWSTNKFRTRVNGPKTGSRSTTGGGTNVIGPKKTAGEVPKRALEEQTVSSVNTSSNSGVKSRAVSPNNTKSQVVSRQPVKQRQTIKTRSGNSVGAVSAKPNRSKVKTYYASSNSSNVVKNRTYSASQNTRNRATNYSKPTTNRASNSNATRRNTSTSVTRKPTKNYYNSGTSVKPKTNTRSNTTRTVRSYVPSSSNNVRKPSSSSSTKSSGSSMRRSSPSSSSSPSRSSGSTRSSGGGRR